MLPSKKDLNDSELHPSTQLYSTSQRIDSLRAVVDFCLSRRACRRMKLLSFFEEIPDRRPNCENCDSCLEDTEELCTADVTEHSRSLIQIFTKLKVMKGGAGVTMKDIVDYAVCKEENTSQLKGFLFRKNIGKWLAHELVENLFRFALLDIHVHEIPAPSHRQTVSGLVVIPNLTKLTLRPTDSQTLSISLRQVF